MELDIPTTAALIAALLGFAKLVETALDIYHKWPKKPPRD